MSAIDCCVVSAVETNGTDVVTASVKSVQRGIVKLIFHLFLNCGIMLIYVIIPPTWQADRCDETCWSGGWEHKGTRHTRRWQCYIQR